MATVNPVTTIKVKSPAALASVIAWTQADFFPAHDPAAMKTDAAETVRLRKLDVDSLWFDE
jgi:hypothetical protein